MAKQRRQQGAPQDAAGLVEAGRRRLHEGRLREAEALLKRALELQPDYALARKMLGWVAAERRDWKRAVAEWRAALAALSKPQALAKPQATDADSKALELAEARYSLAAALCELGGASGLAEAAALLEQPSSGEFIIKAKELRATLATRQGDWRTAEPLWGELAQQALEQAGPPGRLAHCLTEQAKCCLPLGLLGRARAALDKALAMQPEAVLARQLLAQTAAEQQDWPLAADCWCILLDSQSDSAPAADLPPESAQALQALAEALTEMGAFRDAEALGKRLAAGAEQAALALRVSQAAKQQDGEALRVAWGEYHERLPDTADANPAYLKFIGGEAADESPGFPPPPFMTGPGGKPQPEALLGQAPDGDAAHRILSYLELRLPRSEHIALARQAADAFPDTPALQAAHISGLAQNLANEAELQEAQARASAFCERFPQDPQGWRLLAAAAVAASDLASVERLANASGSPDLQLYLAAKQGEHDRAHALWQQIQGSRYIHGLERQGLDLRLLNAEPPKGFLGVRRALSAAPARRRFGARALIRAFKGQDRILLFAHFRNEMEFAPWFLDYYRALGVDWFFIVDNLSDDGTPEFLAKQQDVTVFASADNFMSTVSGICWVNELIRRYGEDNWCLFVDADEQLILPGAADGDLRRFVDAMAARGAEVAPGFALDTFPQDLAALAHFRPGDSPLDASHLIDTDYFFFGKQEPGFYAARGGARDRLFSIRDKVEQTPILRGGGGRLYIDNHGIAYAARASSQRVASLHHKLLREALEIRKEAGAPGGQRPQPKRQRTERPQPKRQRTESPRVADRDQYCRFRHAQYRKAGLLQGADEIPRGPHTVAYQGPAQLEALGLIGPTRGA